MAAVVSLLLSPITAVWAVALGVPTALLAWALDQTLHPPVARVVLLAALGVVLGALPYILAGVLIEAL